MSLVFGHADPALQRDLLELCFSGKKHDPYFRAPRIHRLDQALTDDTLSGEQFRILPLLYKLSSLEELSKGSKAKIINMYKHTLCRNSLMLDRLARLHQRFNEFEFEPMIGLKGLPALSYLNLGLGARPMADVDILVPDFQKRPREALEVLEGMGFKKKSVGFRSLTVVSLEGLEFDIHWYLHDWALSNQLVQVVKAHTVSYQIGSQHILIPCVEHHLAHTLSHGILTNTLTFDARWVFDFLSVYTKQIKINVERFAEFSNQVAAPQLMREGMENIIAELPMTVDVDREQLINLKNAVKKNSRFVSWLYRRKPIPNYSSDLVFSELRTPRVDIIKQVFVTYWFIPFQLKAKCQASFFEYCSWLVDFPPPKTLPVLGLLLRKIFYRGPVLLYRLLVGR